MPDGVEHLQRLGVDTDAMRSMPFRGIRWLDPQAPEPIEVEGRFPGRAGLGIRRLDLHEALVRAAEARRTGGAKLIDLRWGWKVLGTARTGGARGEVRALRVADPDGREHEHSARYVVAADGLRSPLRREIGLDGRPEPRVRQRFGVRRHFAVQPWTDCVEVHWGEDAEGHSFEAYVTPVASDEVGVAFLWSGHTASFDDLLAELPELRQRLGDASTRSRHRGMGPLRQRTLGVVRGNVALVGDAAGYVDAITGEGLSVALHQSHLLAAAVAAGDLSIYARGCRRVDRTPRRLTELLLWLQRRPALRRRVFRALSRDPSLFDRFLAVHVRHVAPTRLVSMSPRLAWRLLTA